MLGDSITTEMQNSLWFTLFVETNSLICMYRGKKMVASYLSVKTE